MDYGHLQFILIFKYFLEYFSFIFKKVENILRFVIRFVDLVTLLSILESYALHRDD